MQKYHSAVSLEQLHQILDNSALVQVKNDDGKAMIRKVKLQLKNEFVGYDVNGIRKIKY